MMKILVIEDSKLVSELLQRQLTEHGFDCTVEGDGLKGFTRAKEMMPDLIILDVMLPAMNGFKICRLLKFDKRYKKIPIIMLTTRSEQEDRQLGMSTGADAYLTKPFDIDVLLAEIEKLVSTPSAIGQS